MRRWHATISPEGAIFRVDWQVMEEPGPTLDAEGSGRFKTLDEALAEVKVIDERERKRSTVVK